MATTKKTTTKKTTKTGNNGKSTAKVTSKKAPATRRSAAKTEAVVAFVPEIPTRAVPKKQAPAGATDIVTNVMSDDDRRRMIAERAYFIAERRGFEGGDPTQDWLAAEAEVCRGLSTRAVA